MLNIIHLDDHRLFQKGLISALQKEDFPANINGFTFSSLAFEYIRTGMENHTKIDCVITDYNHFEDNGLVFAIKLREPEKEFHLRSPILLLTMCFENDELTNATKDGIFDGYLPKSASIKEITLAIEGMIKNYCCPTKCLKALSSLHDLTPTPLQRRGARTLNQ